MNIMKSEQIDIIILKKQVVIDMYQNIIILIKMQLQSHLTQYIIYIKSNLVISLHIKQLISIHHIRHLFEQNFLFKSEDLLNLVLYAHIVDFSLVIIMT